MNEYLRVESIEKKAGNQRSDEGVFTKVRRKVRAIVYSERSYNIMSVKRSSRNYQHKIAPISSHGKEKLEVNINLNTHVIYNKLRVQIHLCTPDHLPRPISDPPIVLSFAFQVLNVFYITVDSGLSKVQ